MILAHLAGFSPGQVLTDLLVASVAGLMAWAKRYYKRELIDPMRELKDDFKNEKRKRKVFQKVILARMAHYEEKASAERQLQISERARVLGRKEAK
jgi:aspartokinase